MEHPVLSIPLHTPLSNTAYIATGVQNVDDVFQAVGAVDVVAENNVTVPVLEFRAIAQVRCPHCDMNGVLTHRRNVRFDLDQTVAVGFDEECSAKRHLVLRPAHTICCADRRLFECGHGKSELYALLADRAELFVGLSTLGFFRKCRRAGVKVLVRDEISGIEEVLKLIVYYYFLIALSCDHLYATQTQGFLL